MANRYRRVQFNPAYASAYGGGARNLYPRTAGALSLEDRMGPDYELVAQSPQMLSNSEAAVSAYGTPATAEEAARLTYEMQHGLGSYTPLPPVQIRPETLQERWNYTPGGAYAGGGRQGPMVGTYGLDNMPTAEERASAEWQAKLAATRARAAELLPKYQNRRSQALTQARQMYQEGRTYEGEPLTQEHLREMRKGQTTIRDRGGRPEIVTADAEIGGIYRTSQEREQRRLAHELDQEPTIGDQDLAVQRGLAEGKLELPPEVERREQQLLQARANVFSPASRVHPANRAKVLAQIDKKISENRVYGAVPISLHKQRKTGEQVYRQNTVLVDPKTYEVVPEGTAGAVRMEARLDEKGQPVIQGFRGLDYSREKNESEAEAIDQYKLDYAAWKDREALRMKLRGLTAPGEDGMGKTLRYTDEEIDQIAPSLSEPVAPHQKNLRGPGVGVKYGTAGYAPMIPYAEGAQPQPAAAGSTSVSYREPAPTAASEPMTPVSANEPEEVRTAREILRTAESKPVMTPTGGFALPGKYTPEQRQMAAKIVKDWTTTGSTETIRRQRAAAKAFRDGLPRPKTKAERDALPSGTWYMAPDGKPTRKI